MKTSPTTILAIETSCDETAVAVVQKNGDEIQVLSNIVSSQIALHAPFGGVVPDLAAREHAQNIIPVLEESLTKANVHRDDIDCLAVTSGPGLIPALLIGTIAAKTLAYTWKKPLLGIHHIEGHIYANALQNDLKFPLLALVVSGGHTQLVLMQDHLDYTILGETQDDAVGEAFDKVAKMLNLPYPGGPIVARFADEYAQLQSSQSNHSSHSKTSSRHQSKEVSENFSEKKYSKIIFPRPMIHSNDYHFSFSGLKTSVLYTIKKHEELKKDETFIQKICYEFQEAVIETLLAKTSKALREFHPKTLVIAGGVSANTTLRARLTSLASHDFPHIQFISPDFQYSLDNAAMIGVAAAFRYDTLLVTEKTTLLDSWSTLRADANLVLS